MKPVIYPPNAEKIRFLAARDRRSDAYTVNRLLETALARVKLPKPLDPAGQK